MWLVVTKYINLGQQLTLDINATNSVAPGVTNCQNNPAGLIFAVTSSDCASCSGSQLKMIGGMPLRS